jgi:hypothetical protein
MLLRALGISPVHVEKLLEKKEQRGTIIKQISSREQKIAKLDKENEALGGTPLSDIL